MLQDLRLTFRQAGRSPVGTAVVVLILGVGIGASLSMLGVLDAVLFRPLPYADPGELVLTLQSLPKEGRLYDAVSYQTFRDWRRRNQVFLDLAAVSLPRSLVLTGIEAPTSILAEFASSNYFSLLGIEPVLGRTFTSEEDLVPGGEPPVILSYALWQGALGGDRDVTGDTLRINGLGFHVIGVMPRSFRGLQWDPVDAWLPLGAAPSLLGPTYHDRTRTWLTTLGRLGEGVSLSQARQGMEQVAAALETEYPTIYEDRSVSLHPLAEFYFGPELRQGLHFLLLASLLVLLLCSTNVGALFLLQALGRRREIAIRASLGAGPGRIVRQFVVQTLVYSILGSALGVLLTRTLTPYLVALSDIRPATFDARYVGSPVLLIAVVLALALGGVLGALPPFIVSRLSLTEALKESGRSGAGSPWGRRLRGAFVTVELALGFVLLASATLLVQSLRDLTSSSPGFDTSNLLTLRVDLPALDYGSEATLRFAERLVDDVAAIAGVEATTITGPHLAPRAAYTVEATTRERLADGNEDASSTLNLHSVLPDFFSTLGIPLLRGRVFARTDDRQHSLVAVISQSAAELLWPGDEALGRQVHLDPAPAGTTGQWHTIVGVVGDVRHRGFNSPLKGDNDIYLSLRQHPQRTFFVLARLAVDPRSVQDRIRAVGLDLDSDLPLDRFGTMRQRFALAGADTRFQTVLVSIFAGLALLLAAVGLYGVLALTLREQRRELAVRIALGATRRDLARVVLGQCLLLLVPGLLLGVLGCLAVGPILAATLYGVSPYDPATLLFGAVALALVALCSAIPPTLRATSIDPAASLRAD